MVGSWHSRIVGWSAVVSVLLLLIPLRGVDAATTLGDTLSADSAQAGTAVKPSATASPGAESTSNPNADALIEIVVTANRREESLQKSSLAIDAFSEAELRQAGVSQAADMSELAEGLQVSFTGSTANIYIRGVGDDGSNPLANPGVAFNVDGVYVGRPESVGVNFFDIERVEILKGPQGTLYGRNTSGGAINLITNSPTLDSVKGTADAEVGDYGLYHIDAALNLPITDVIAIRLAANRIKRDGYLSDDTDDDDQTAARAKLLFKPNDDLSLLLSVDGEQVRGVGGGYVYLPQSPGSSAWEGSTSSAAQNYAHTINPNLISGGPAPFVHNNFYATSAQLDWILGFATLTILPAFRHTDVNSLQYNAESFAQTAFSNEETVEARLGHVSDSLKWVVGAYYYNERDPGQVNVYVGPGLLQANPLYAPSAESYALFGEATYSVSDTFRLIAGARVTDEIHKLTGNFYVSPTQNGAFVDEEHFNGDKAFGSVTWKAGAEYDLAPQNMLYFTASTGFKSGGITQTVPPDNIYRPETVLAYELGSRNRFFNNTLQVNLEAFEWHYKNQQNTHLTFDDLGNVNALTQNAGSATLYGLDADVLYRPTHNDTVHVATEFDHSRYSTFTYEEPTFAYSPAATGCANTGTVAGPFVPLAVIDCSGNQLPHAPLWSGQADVTHDFDIASGAAIAATLADRFSSATWLAVDFTPAERAHGYSILDASVAYLATERNYSLTAYVRNISNAKEYTGGVEQAQAPPLFAAVIMPPRTYGLQAHYEF